MQCMKRVQDSDRQIDGLAGRYRSSIQPGRQRLAVEQLHDEKRTTVMFADFVNLAGVRVLHGRRRTRLAKESLVRGARGKLGADHLESDGAPEALV